MRVRLTVLALVMSTIVGCGSGSDTSADPSASVAAAIKRLKGAGWKPRSVKGVPRTVTGAPQRFYLQTTAPDGTQIDLQFFATPDQAQAERTAVVTKFKGFRATAVGNAIAFSRATGKRTIPPADLDALRKLLAAESTQTTSRTLRRLRAQVA